MSRKYFSTNTMDPYVDAPIVRRKKSKPETVEVDSDGNVIKLVPVRRRSQNRRSDGGFPNDQSYYGPSQNYNPYPTNNYSYNMSPRNNGSYYAVPPPHYHHQNNNPYAHNMSNYNNGQPKMLILEDEDGHEITRIVSSQEQTAAPQVAAHPYALPPPPQNPIMYHPNVVPSPYIMQPQLQPHVLTHPYGFI